MAISCNCKGGNGALDCDNCRQTGDCDKVITCDICGNECYEYYYDVDGNEVCEDCIHNYRRSIDY